MDFRSSQPSMNQSRELATQESVAQSHEELRLLFRRVVTSEDRDELRRAIDDLTDAEAALRVARSEASFALVDKLLSRVNARLSLIRRRLEGPKPT